LDAGGNIVTKEEEKAEVLHASLPQSLIAKPAVLGISSLLSWKTGKGSRMNAP